MQPPTERRVVSIEVGQIYRYNHDDDPSYIYGVVRVANGVPSDQPSITLHDLQEDEPWVVSVDYVTGWMTQVVAFPANHEPGSGS